MHQIEIWNGILEVAQKPSFREESQGFILNHVYTLSPLAIFKERIHIEDQCKGQGRILGRKLFLLDP